MEIWVSLFQYRKMVYTWLSINMQQNKAGLPCLFVSVHFRYALTHMALSVSVAFRLARLMFSCCVTISLPLDPASGTMLELCSIFL